MVFCILGVIGACGSDITEQKQLVSIQTNRVLDVLNSKVSTTFSRARASSANIQKITCFVEKGDCIIDGVRMKQMVEINSTTEMQIHKSITADNMIDTIVDTAGEAYLDYINTGSSSGDRKTFTDTEIKAITEIKTQLRSTTTDQDFMECTASSINEQLIDGRNNDGSVVIKMIDMKQTTSILSKCIFNKFLMLLQNINLSDEVKTKLEAESEIRKKDIVGNITESASSLFMPIIIAVITFIIFLLIMFAIIFFRRRS